MVPPTLKRIRASGPPDSVIEPASSTLSTLVSSEPQIWQRKKKKSKKMKTNKDAILVSDRDQVYASNAGDLAFPAIAGSHPSLRDTPHGGLIHGIDSNWKQLQAAMRKGQAARGIRKVSKNMHSIEPSKDTGGLATSKERQSGALCPRNTDSSLTKVLAMDCEMVGVGFDGKRNALARVSLVNNWGNVVYDKHVQPMERVTDFRTNISGVRWRDLKKAEDFTVVQKEVAQLTCGRVLVGHGVHNDLKVLYLSHPKKDIRDTSVYLPLRSKNGRPRSLRHIAVDILGVKIQESEHCSVQDARAAMYVYEHLKKEWENSISQR